MLKIITLLILISLLTSCHSHDTKRPPFLEIDLTYCNGWTKTVSLNIDSVKNIRIRIEEHTKNVLYYQDILPDSSFNKISSTVEGLLRTKHDSIINTPAPDGGGYSLIVRSLNKTINSVVHCARICYEPLDSFVFGIVELSGRIKHISTDTAFRYKSYERFVPPPALKDLIKFVPPVIKEDDTK